MKPCEWDCEKLSIEDVYKHAIDDECQKATERCIRMAMIHPAHLEKSMENSDET